MVMAWCLWVISASALGSTGFGDVDPLLGIPEPASAGVGVEDVEASRLHRLRPRGWGAKQWTSSWNSHMYIVYYIQKYIYIYIYMDRYRYGYGYGFRRRYRYRHRYNPGVSFMIECGSKTTNVCKNPRAEMRNHPMSSTGLKSMTPTLTHGNIRTKAIWHGGEPGTL